MKIGADAVRWFILSDSPPEKDVQWSDVGVSSASKFLQKIWNLNHLISQRKQTSVDDNLEKEFTLTINNHINKIDESIQNFRFNVSIALFYETYNLIKSNLNKKISNNTFKKNMENIFKLMIPFTPHLAFESLELMNCKTVNIWPKIDKKNISNNVKLAVQINGKTRDIINIKKDMNEKEINKIILDRSKASKYLNNKKINKVIFVQNKIINYIIPTNE